MAPAPKFRIAGLAAISSMRRPSTFRVASRYIMLLPMCILCIVSVFLHWHVLNLDEERLADIAYDSGRDMVYFTRAKLLVGSMRKGGSSSLYNWLWIGVSGNVSGWKDDFCGSYAQYIYSTCWRGEVVALLDLSPSDQRAVLRGPEALRVVVQRDPMARLLSAWKSKFACD